MQNRIALTSHHGTTNGNPTLCRRKVERRLTKHLRTLSERGSDVIPVTSFKRISNNDGRLPEGVADKVRKMGVLIVRDVIPAKEIEEMMTDLLKYMYENRAFPQGQNHTQVSRNGRRPHSF